MEPQGYWSLETCGWLASPGPGDPLATPWSGYAFPPLSAPPRGLDAADVLRMRAASPAPAGVPAQRESEPVRQDAVR